MARKRSSGSNKSASGRASKASSPKFKPINSGAVHGKMPRTMGFSGSNSA